MSSTSSPKLTLKLFYVSEKIESAKNSRDSRFNLRQKLETVKAFYEANFIVLIVSKLIFLGIILRFIIIRSSLGRIDSSEAINLLNAKDLTNGHFLLMRSSQSIGGALETYLLAPFVAIWGMSQSVTWVVPTLFLLATSYVLWRSFEQTPHKQTMRLVMGCLWIAPSFFVISSTQATGHFASQIFIQVSIFATAYYAAHSLLNQKYFFAWAFLCGIAFWINPVSLATSIMCLMWIFESAPVLKKLKLKATGFFISGSILFWAYLVNNLVTIGKLLPDQSVLNRVANLDEKPFDTFGRIFGLYTYSGAKTNGDNDPLILTIIFGALFIGIWILVGLGMKRFDKKKPTDFSTLQVSLFAVWLAAIILFFAIKRNLPIDYLIEIIIPALFLIITASQRKIIISLAMVIMFLVSVNGISASISEVPDSTSRAISEGNSTLQKMNVRRAVASRDLAFPIDVKSVDEIFVTPFDGNNFDSRRSKIVHNDIQAIVVETESKSQNELALCVQAYFGEAFERVSTKELDIYVVDKQRRSKIWSVIQTCNGRS